MGRALGKLTSRGQNFAQLLLHILYNTVLVFFRTLSTVLTKKVTVFQTFMDVHSPGIPPPPSFPQLSKASWALQIFSAQKSYPDALLFKILLKLLNIY